MQKINKLVILLLLLLPAMAYCQQFSHAAKLDNITADGFYSIQIDPEISANTDASLKDLRIVNSKGNQVPYLLKTILPELKNDDFVSLPITGNSVNDSGQTTLLLDNTQKAYISEIALVVRNASVSRIARLSGSDDGIKWYAIAEGVELRGGQNADKDRFVLNINFTVSSYRYLKLVINNYKNDPLNIIAANYKAIIPWKKPNYQKDNPAVQFFQKDSADGYSYIKVLQQKPYHINEIWVAVDKPKFYNRRLEVQWKTGYAEFMIRPNASAYSFPTFNDTEFRLRIYNGDNPPLKIAAIYTSQDAKYLVTYLEKGDSYELLMGNAQANVPDYDLSSFKDSIPANTPAVKVLNIRANDQQPGKEEKKSNVSLWLIIIAVLAILSFFTWNLTKELKKRNS